MVINWRNVVEPSPQTTSNTILARMGVRKLTVDYQLGDPLYGIDVTVRYMPHKHR